MVLSATKGRRHDKEKRSCVVGYCGVDSSAGEEKPLVGSWRLAEGELRVYKTSLSGVEKGIGQG